MVGMVSLSIFFLLAAVQAATPPTTAELERAVVAADARLFHAGFEGCTPEILAELLAPEFTMFHDLHGKVADSREAFVAIVSRQCAARAPGGTQHGYRNRRELVPGSRTVRRLGDWGALEEASHIFFEWRPGSASEAARWQLVGGARYMHLWQWTPGGVRLVTSYSYDHGAAAED